VPARAGTQGTKFVGRSKGVGLCCSNPLAWPAVAGSEVCGRESVSAGAEGGAAFRTMPRKPAHAHVSPRVAWRGGLRGAVQQCGQSTTNQSIEAAHLARPGGGRRLEACEAPSTHRPTQLLCGTARARGVRGVCVESHVPMSDDLRDRLYRLEGAEEHRGSTLPFIYNSMIVEYMLTLRTM